MKRTLFSRKHTMIGLLGAILLSPTLLATGAAHAATAPNRPLGTIPTNLPGVFAFPAPPADFNPATASTADLQRYGFPLPPNNDTSSQQYQQWLQVVRGAMHSVVPAFTSKPSVKHGTSVNWSGAVSYTSKCPVYLCLKSYPNEVWGGWTVPSVGNSTQTSFSATWVGLDGSGNNQVEQIGTEQDEVCFFGLYCVSQYYTWFELFPDGSQGINLSIQPGDDMYADVGYDTRDNEITFFLQDNTTGNYVAFSTPAKYGCGCVSSEWITERPTINGSLPALADFRLSTFSDAYFRTQFGGVFPAISPGFGSITVDMVNGSGSTLAYGYAPGVDRVDSSWVNYS